MFILARIATIVLEWMRTPGTPDSNRLNRLIKLQMAISIAMVISLLSGQSKIALCQQGDPIVRLDTNKGSIYIRVFQSMVPTTANNFLDLVSRGFYSGKIFHRIETWCIQGGDPNGDGRGVFVDPETGTPRFIPLEINRNLRHTSAGVVAMARGPGPNTASCQFYILKQPMPQLDGKYAIFGKVIGGANVPYSIQYGDTITSAVINPPETLPGANKQAQANQQGGTAKANKSRGPLTPYVPPATVEDSGF